MKLLTIENTLMYTYAAVQLQIDNLEKVITHKDNQNTVKSKLLTCVRQDFVNIIRMLDIVDPSLRKPGDPL